MAKHYNNINTAKEHSVESIPNPEEGMSYDKFVETVPKIKTHMNATQVLNIMGQPLLQWRYITTKPSEVIVEGVAITFKGKEAVKIDPLLVKGTNITDNEYSEKARLIRNILFEKNNKNYFVSVEPINTTHTIILLNKYKYFSYEITHCYDPEGGHYSNSRYVLAINTADGALQLLRDDTKVANHISHLSCKSDSEKDIINITKLFLILNGYRLIEKQDNIIKSLNKKDWKYRIEKLENGWMIQASFLYCMSSVYHYKLEITDKGKIKIVERPEFPRAL